MDRINLTNDLSFSRIIQGFWRVNSWDKSDEELLGFMEECLEQGITTFDTADIYMSEEAQGRAMKLKSSMRDKIEIVTKCGIKPPTKLFDQVKTPHYDSSKEHILLSVDNSLMRLGVDYIDVLLIHRPDFIMNPEEMAEAFKILRKSGKVREIGVSNFKASQFRMLQEYCDHKLVTNQLEISPTYLNYFTDGTLDCMMEKRVAPMAWSPLAGGRIFTKSDERESRLRITLEKIKEEVGANSIDEVIYAWLLLHPVNIMPIVGSSKIERTKAAVNALSIKLKREQWYEIWQSSLGRSID
ncbi:MAG: aldo/keto reductase [Clostridium sp.]